MTEGRALLLLGIALLLAGLALSVVPTYVQRPAAEPEFRGTLWYVGLPLALAGAGLAAWSLRARRAGKA